MTIPSSQAPHPLTGRIAALYVERRLRGPILEVAAGSGRNTRALVEMGLPIVATPDETPLTQLPGGRETYAAALSTHGYLHGTTAKLRVGLAELRRVLKPGAPIAITLGSIRDARFGFGTPEEDEENTFAPGDGPEAGIPHAYFDRDGAIALLRPGFTIDRLEERAVDEIVGRWAHEPADAGGMWHWFVEARRNESATPKLAPEMGR